MKLSDFDYRLPKELIAQYPLPQRDASRLLVLDRQTRRMYHRRFPEVIEYLNGGDTIVLNDTKVIPARLIGRREKTGGKTELFLLEKIDTNSYHVLIKPAKKVRPGSEVIFGDGQLRAKVISDNSWSKIVEFNSEGEVEEVVKKLGQTPLPPYIKREPQPSDSDRYQTVYAHSEGATAAPTAGLHFTKELLEEITQKGINIVYLTLHVSYGTFAPITCEDITQHKMHREYFSLPEQTASVLNETKRRGKKIVAVGTTSCRTLETVATMVEKKESVTQNCRLSTVDSRLQAEHGWTNLYIFPSYKFKVVDALITNFHLPRSTLLLLVSAFCGRQFLLEAYREATKSDYRFYSYGDAMLIV